MIHNMKRAKSSQEIGQRTMIAPVAKHERQGITGLIVMLAMTRQGGGKDNDCYSAKI